MVFYQIDELAIFLAAVFTLKASELEELLLALKPFSIPLAMISNASLFWMERIQKSLHHRDWLSVKID